LTSLAFTLCGLSVPVCVQVAVGVSHASMRGAAAVPGACLLTSRHQRLELPWRADSAAPHRGTACGTAHHLLSSPQAWRGPPARPAAASSPPRPSCSPSRCILTPSTLSAGAPPSDLHGSPGAGARGGPGRRDRCARHGEKKGYWSNSHLSKQERCLIGGILTGQRLIGQN
jgi:hypothetical protein